MAKSVHSKRRKANKSLQRRVLWAAQGKERLEKTHERLMKRTFGTGDDDYIARKKNAFRFPKDPSSIFPKADKPKYIEKRAAYVDPRLRNVTKGIKVSKLEAKRQNEEIENALKKAEERFTKKQNNLSNNEDMNIDIPAMDGDYNFSTLDKELKNIEKKNKKNKKDNNMFVEDEQHGEDRPKIVRNKIKKKKKSKSHYIVNH